MPEYTTIDFPPNLATDLSESHIDSVLEQLQRRPEDVALISDLRFIKTELESNLSLITSNTPTISEGETEVTKGQLSTLRPIQKVFQDILGTDPETIQNAMGGNGSRRHPLPKDQEILAITGLLNAHSKRVAARPQKNLEKAILARDAEIRSIKTRLTKISTVL